LGIAVLYAALKKRRRQKNDRDNPVYSVRPLCWAVVLRLAGVQKPEAQAVLMKIKQSWKNLLRPYFGCEFDVPCPFIWAGWWLITFDLDVDFITFLKSIEISFMPD